MRLLVIEDDATLRESLTRKLGEAGFAVEQAADGTEGLYFAEEYPIDLAIIDLGLPGMSGLEIIHYAVSLGHHRSLIYLLRTEDLADTSYGLEGVALEQYRAIAGDGLFRFSVGLEDPEDICADLERVL